VNVAASQHLADLIAELDGPEGAAAVRLGPSPAATRRCAAGFLRRC
jgi:hypothetical protein